MHQPRVACRFIISDDAPILASQLPNFPVSPSPPSPTTDAMDVDPPDAPDVQHDASGDGTHPAEPTSADWDLCSSPYTAEFHKNRPKTYGCGNTFIDDFNKDQFSQQRTINLYFPFASKSEWQLAQFLLQSNLSMAATNTFLALDLVMSSHSEPFIPPLIFVKIKVLQLTFKTAKDLRGRAELLPSGPAWKVTEWPTPTDHPVKNPPMNLFYHDALECMQTIIGSPLVKDHIHFEPLRLFNVSTQVMRVYTEWLTGDVAWNMQVKLPQCMLSCMV